MSCKEKQLRYYTEQPSRTKIKSLIFSRDALQYVCTIFHHIIGIILPMKRKALENSFIADAMLGKLTKWLRLAGVDVEYDKQIDDDTLIKRAMYNGLVILTRDRSIVKRKNVGGHLLIWSDHLPEQIFEFTQVFEIDTLESAFTRCIRCNTLLEEVEKDSLEAQIHPYVWKTQNEFRGCNNY